MTATHLPPNLAPLRNVSSMLQIVDRVQHRDHNLPGIGAFYGPSGWGKTSAVTVAVNEFNAWSVQVKSVWNPSYLAEVLCKELGLIYPKNVARAVDLIGAKLARANRPLILDDAQYLMQKRLVDMVRDIYETCETAIILVGEEKLPQSLTRWENVHNRILAWQPAAACDLADTIHLADIYCAGVSVDHQLLAEVVEASGGSIRRVSTNLAALREFARTRGLTSLDLKAWGGRNFDTGQPPVRDRGEIPFEAAPATPTDSRRKAG